MKVLAIYTPLLTYHKRVEHDPNPIFILDIPGKYSEIIQNLGRCWWENCIWEKYQKKGSEEKD